jgi:hypothetical protein
VPGGIIPPGSEGNEFCLERGRFSGPAPTSVNCPMFARVPDGIISNGTSQQVPADAARLKGHPSNARPRPKWRVRFHLPAEPYSP